MDNITFLDNPHSNIKDDIVIRQDYKVAKINGTTKKPYVKKHWKENRPSNLHLADSNVHLEFKEEANNTVKDYTSLLESLNISTIEHFKSANSSGAKKLRVNKIVNVKVKKVDKNSVKVSMTPEEEVVNLINQINVVESPVEVKKEAEEIHGRHEKTGEIPISDINNAIRNEFTQSIPVTTSRMEKNAQEHVNVAKEEVSKQESKAFDWDLYNNKVHGDKAVNDISRQLQGAKEEYAYEKEESRKLAEEIEKAVRERDELERFIENQERIKTQQERQELAETLNNIKTLKEENIAKTSDLSSIQNELAQLRAKKQAMESAKYDEYEEHSDYSRSGRLAA